MGFRRKAAARSSAGLLIMAALIFAARPWPAQAQNSHPRAGTSSAAFLKLKVGARPLGMGGAFTAVADDVNALYWNPAGLAGQKRPRVAFTHEESFSGLKHEFLGYLRPVHGSKNKAVWGFGVNSMFVPNDLERRSGTSEVTGAFANLTRSEGRFGAYDLALSASYGRLWPRRQAFGFTVKYIRQDIDGGVGETGALDLGWKWRDAVPNLSLGAALLNLGPGVKFRSRHDLPLTLNTGAAYRLKAWRSLLAFDVSVPRDDYPLLAWGLETGRWKSLVFRTGYQYRWYGNPMGALSGWRMGLGLVERRLALDYAVAPFGRLGLSHRVSLGWRLGSLPAQKAAVGPQTPASPAPKPVPSLPPALPSLNEDTGGRTFAYSVDTVLKALSGRGAQFAVRALAPSEELELRAVEFRTRLPSATDFRLEVSEMRPPTLAGGLKARKAYRLRLDPKAATHQGSLLWDARGDSGLVLMGFWGREWRRLETKSVEDGGVRYLRARFEELPQAVAAFPGPPGPGKP